MSSERQTLVTADHDNYGENADPRAELTAVEVEVEKMTMALRNLMDKTHVLKARINGLYAPVLRQLPPEIISQIFEFCLSPFTQPTKHFNVEPEQDVFIPLKFGAVCTAWRRIAWSTPSLWTSIVLHLNSRTIENQVHLLEEWLSRTGQLPLSIRLHSEEDNYWTPPATPGWALGVLSTYKSRWRDLDLRIPTTCFKYLPPSTEALPMLNSLHLNPPGGQGERRHKVDMRSSAQITDLNLSCVYLISMDFDWSVLTHLRLEAFYVDECLVILNQTPRLVSCSLRNIIGGDDGHPIPDGPIDLPCLLYMSIDNEKDTAIPLLIEKLHLPRVAELSYSARNLHFIPELSSLISRSTSLHTFSLVKTSVYNDGHFIQLMTALANIKKLVIDIPTSHSSRRNSSPLNDAFLECCDPTKVKEEAASCLLPILETLDYTGPQSFTWPILLETLEHRQFGNARDGTSTVPEDSKPIDPWRVVNLTLDQRDVNIPKHDDADVLRQIQILSEHGTYVALKIKSVDEEGRETVAVLESPSPTISEPSSGSASCRTSSPNPESFEASN